MDDFQVYVYKILKLWLIFNIPVGKSIYLGKYKAYIIYLFDEIYLSVFYF